MELFYCSKNIHHEIEYIFAEKKKLKRKIPLKYFTQLRRTHHELLEQYMGSKNVSCGDFIRLKP